jgi:predicted ATP-binding protein involved in virulence
MADSQLAQIKDLEETVRQLIRQTAEMREQAESTNDLEFRRILSKAADECDEAARNLAAGLRGMRENLQ